jgi:predicted O-methyltransferase YrrM
LNQPFFQLGAYITYWLNAVDAHSLHSPFFYDFYTRVVRTDKSPSHENFKYADAYRTIEASRDALLKDKSVIDVLDLGAGSRHTKGSTRRIADIARHSLSDSRYGQLYQRAIALYQCKYVLELGTSLGINAMYLAATPGARVTTIEGSPLLASRAVAVHEGRHLKNVDVVCGNLDHVLPGIVDQMPRIDFAFLDANHRFAPTLQYFHTIVSKLHDRSIVVLDDIHDSDEMQRAWNEIRKHPRARATADLFRCGFVFFEPSLNSQHFVLQI